MASTAGSWYDGENPFVSIIILNFNNAKITIRCLEAAWKHTTGYKYEILLVDNGSDPHHVAALAAVGPHLRLVRLPTNHYFGGANNIAAESAKGEVLVFLNNDAFVTSGWLSPLLDILLKKFRAGGVGSKLMNLDGTLQEAGAFIDSAGDPIRVGMTKPYHPDEEDAVKVVDYCSAACFAIKRQLFLDLGSFDEAFSPAYYEDVDLCLRIAKADLYVYYCPSSVVAHALNVTSNELWAPAELHEIIARNRRRFVARWGGFLKARESWKPQSP